MSAVRHALGKSGTHLGGGGAGPGGVLFLALAPDGRALFTMAPSPTGHQCRAIASGLPGPEDFEVDAAHDAIIVSSTDRQRAQAIPIPATGFMP